MSAKIFIFDTTLRDGEQSPGAALNVEEKVQIAHHLEKLNVDVIEAGFPISSPDDFEAVSRIAQEVEGPEICGLSRVLEKDITKCWEAIQHAKKPRIHTFVGTSDIHVEEILRKTREEVLVMAVDAVKLARSLCETVEFSPMDATRTEPQYLYEVVQATIEAGASIINIPDTVGYAIPEQFGALIRDIHLEVPSIDKAILSVHCHDDLGQAVANSLVAVNNGARQVECAINGIGERAGNTALEEIVMAIRTRKDFFTDIAGMYTEVSPKGIYPISRLVSRLMGFTVQPNKAIVGANAFKHSSGIHQDGVIKERTTFEIMKPQDVGIPEDIEQIELTPRSGHKAVRHRLEKLGYELTDEQLDKIYDRFIAVADKKKEVQDADLEAIVQDTLHLVPDTWALEYVRVNHLFAVDKEYDIKIVPSASVGLKNNNELFELGRGGNGPVDATFRAINEITGLKVELTDYTIKGVTGGTDALGEATVKLTTDSQTAIGYGASTDIIEASAKAYVSAINKFIYLENKKAEAR